MAKMNMLIVAAGYGNETRDTDWQVDRVATAEEAVSRMQQVSFDLIVIDQGLTGTDRSMLKAIAGLQQAEAALLFPSNEKEIDDAAAVLAASRKAAARPVYSIIDNGFGSHPLYSNDNQ